MTGVVGCVPATTGVSQKEYDALKADYEQSKSDYESLKKDYGRLQENYDELLDEWAELKAENFVNGLGKDDEQTWPDTETNPPPVQTENDDKYGIGLQYYEAGQYKVGQDIPEGEYVLITTGNIGYFAISKDANQDEIITNSVFETNSIVTVVDGEYFELTGCIAIDSSEFYATKVINTDNGNLGLMLKIGYDLPAGEYKLIQAEGEIGYYSIYESSRQEEILTNEVFENSTYVKVEDGQYLKLSGCTIEK